MDILQEYYEIKTALDLLTKEAEDKKTAVIEVLKALPGGKAEIAGAKFSLRKDYVYEFSNKTQQKAAQIEFDLADHKKVIKDSQDFIKQMKAVEIEDGTATLIETKFLPVMTPIKESLKKGGK